MDKKGRTRTRMIRVRLSPAEWDGIQKDFAKTTCRYISEYARNRILGAALTVNYRNQSIDESVTEIIKFREHLGNLIQELHLDGANQPENSALLPAENCGKNEGESWRILALTITETNVHLERLADLWLQDFNVQKTYSGYSSTTSGRCALE